MHKKHTLLFNIQTALKLKYKHKIGKNEGVVF